MDKEFFFTFSARSFGCCLTFLIFVFWLLRPEFGWASVADDLRLETSDFMKTTAYRHADRVAACGTSSGAFSAINIAWEEKRSGVWHIEEQRCGADVIIGGIAEKDSAAIARGLKILHWGFEQQQADGSFACPDAFHSTSFFVEAVAHACLILEASEYAQQYLDETGWLKAHLLKAALWMIQPLVEVQGHKGDAAYNHRLYLVAAAWGETGVLCSNHALLEGAEDYVLEGISLQDPSGFNLEKGGYDSNYQAVGMVFAERYYDLVADGEIRLELKAMLEKANVWLASRLRTDGTLDTSGDTRVEKGQELSRNEAFRKFSYPQPCRAFFGWSLISGDQSYRQLAEKAYQGESLHGRP
jgi:hypothetical protein